MIIAYASAHDDPINNPLEDAQVDLSAVSLPTTITLYGAAVDTADAGASFSWAWSILDPLGPTLTSSVTQNVTLNNIAAWHNVRLHLIATNTATGETSEADVNLAPSSSFVEVRVLSENRGIQKVAKGSRSWHPALESWADAIENPVSLNDLSDVTNATGAELDILRGGGLAESNGATLHTHDGDHIADSTATTAGVVVLEETSSAAGSPKVITHERIILTGSATVSIESDGTLHTEIINISGVNEEIPHIVFSVGRHDLYIHRFTAALQNCGNTTTAYTLKLAHGTTAQYIAYDLPNTVSEVTLTPSAANTPVIGSAVSVSNQTVSAGDVLGVYVGTSPSAGSGGQVLHITVEATRAVI